MVPLSPLSRKARQRRGVSTTGIADRDIGRGTAQAWSRSTPPPSPRRGAGEFRNFETDFSRAVGLRR